MAPEYPGRMGQKHMDRLSAVDATFLHQESASAHMHIGGVVVLEGPAPGCGELCYGLLADYEALPDVDVLAEGVEEALGELVGLARAAGDGRTAAAVTPRRRRRAAAEAAPGDAGGPPPRGERLRRPR